MGVKVSRFLKHSYVVKEEAGREGTWKDEPSEEVISDKVVEHCDDGYYSTPPRDLRHLPDPRSITRGILRTPILCQMDEVWDTMMSPVKTRRYLETDLDDVLLRGDYCRSETLSPGLGQAPLASPTLPPFYHGPDPTDHLLQLDLLQPNQSHEHHQKSALYSMKDLSEGVLKIEIPETESAVEGQEEDEDLSTCEPFGRMISKAREFDIAVDSTETVERVCQRILDELLDSQDDLVDLDCMRDSTRGLFDDYSDHEGSSDDLSTLNTDSPLKRLVKGSSHCINMVPPISSRLTSKHYDKEPLTPFNSPLKRKPLGEVNSNIARCSPSLSLKASCNDVENSPLKSLLPLLPAPNSQPPIVKPHRSKWDTDNTLII